MLLLKLAWRNIWRNSRRSYITIASVVMAVLLSTVMGSIQQGQYDQMINNTVGTFVGHLQVQSPDYNDEPTLDHSFALESSLIDSIQNLSTIQAIIPRLDSYTLSAGLNRTRATLVVGIDINAEAYLSDPKEKIVEGEYFYTNSDSSVIIGAGLANYLNLTVGDSLVLIGQGFRGINTAGVLPISGIMKFGLPDLNNALVYMPIETARNYFGAYDRVTSLVIKIHQPKGLFEAEDAIRSVIGSDKVVLNWQILMPEILQAIQADSGSNLIVILILYMVVGFGILGTVLMMTAERKYEFGVIIALGTSRLKMSLIIVLEMFFLSLLGVVFGVLTSLPVIYYFHINPLYFYGDAAEAIVEFGMEPFIQFSMDPDIFLLQATIVFILTLLISIYPLWHMKKLQPVKAMRG
jgi:putative ABC transport system permease protein